MKKVQLWISQETHSFLRGHGKRDTCSAFLHRALNRLKKVKQLAIQEANVLLRVRDERDKCSAFSHRTVNGLKKVKLGQAWHVFRFLAQSTEQIEKS